MIRFEEYLPIATSTTAKSINDAFNNVVFKYGLTRSQCVALYYIDLDGSTNQKQLAKKMNIRESTMTGLLDRMERDKLIERKPDEEDMRRKTISLSNRGDDKLSEISQVTEEFVNEATSKISDKDLEIYQKVLDQMLESTLDWQERKIKALE